MAAVSGGDTDVRVACKNDGSAPSQKLGRRTDTHECTFLHHTRTDEIVVGVIGSYCAEQCKSTSLFIVVQLHKSTLSSPPAAAYSPTPPSQPQLLP